MRVLGIVAVLLALTASLPNTSAQAPDPTEVLSQACATVGGIEPQARDLLPICPRQEPPAPAPNAEEDAAAPAPAAAPPAPQDAQQLADEVLRDAQEIPEDPAGAPEAILNVVAKVVDFVKRLAGLPGAGLAALGEVAANAAGAVGDALARAGDGMRTGATNVASGIADAAKGAANAVADAAKSAVDAIARLLPGADARADADARGGARVPVRDDTARDVLSAVDALTRVR